MRVLLIGAGQAGSQAIRQLRKNDEFELTVIAENDRPQAVKDGLIERVDHVETVTSLNINTLARRFRPDLILVDPAALNALTRVTGGAAFNQSMLEEMVASSEFPCILLASS